MARTFLWLVPHGAEWYSLTSSSRENSRALLDISLSPLCPFGIHWSLVSTGPQTPSLDNSHCSVYSFEVNYQIIYTIWGIGSLKRLIDWRTTSNTINPTFYKPVSISPNYRWYMKKDTIPHPQMLRLLGLVCELGTLCEWALKLKVGFETDDRFHDNAI